MGVLPARGAKEIQVHQAKISEGGSTYFAYDVGWDVRAHAN